MKILLTMNLPYTRVHGGTNRSNQSLAEGLAERHHRVRVVVPALAMPSAITPEELLEGLKADGFDVRSDGEAYIFMMNGVEVHAVIDPTRLRAYLGEQLRGYAPDWALVSAEDQSQNLLDAALKVCPGRVVYLAHTPQMFPFGPASLYPGKARTELVGQAAAIVTISRFVADYIKKWTGFEAFVNHPPHFGAGPFPDFGNFDDGYVLLMNACAVKGISIFLALAERCPDVRFAALPGYGTTQADRAALAALPNVTLLKNRKNLDDILCETRLLLMPSMWIEGFGMAAVDVMLRGIPVLASNFGGLTEAKLGTDYLLPVRPIERFEEQLEDNFLPVPIVPEQDIDAWHRALTEVLSNRAVYERQSKAAREASLKFVNSLSVAPLEEMLLGLSEKKTTRAGVAGEAKKAGEAKTNESSKKASTDIAAALGKMDDLSPEQRAVMLMWLKKEIAQQAGKETKPQTIQKASRDGALPLSFAQQRLWFLDQLEPGSAVYNIPVAVELKGSLNVDALRRTLDEVVRRHEVLRTTFGVVEGQPVQLIAPEAKVDLTMIDISELPLNLRRGEAERLARAEARRPFDLMGGSLLRATLVRLGAEEHVVLLTMHHIISDGWSMGVLVKEVGALYAAFSAGKSSPLAALPIQYADYAVWQRDALRGEALERELSYWRRQLAGAAHLELPTDRVRPAVQTFNGATASVRLTKALSDALKTLSQREDATLFMTMLAAFKALLARYTRQQDIVVGTPVAGRHLPEVENLIGFFVNTLALRTDLGGNPSFRELLARVKEVSLGAFGHQDVPFERVVEEAQAARQMDRSPLFQVVFSLQNASSAATVELPGLELSTQATSSDVAKFDLTWGITETADGLVIGVEYNTDLFESATIGRMTAHFVTLLEGIVARPDERLAALPMLAGDERERLLVEWNATAIDFPKNVLVQNLFEARAEESPAALAVVSGEESLTYDELNRKANRIARRLRALGVGAESLVGVLMERSTEMVAALLGVLKAGGAYLPLDTVYPPERLNFMLADSALAVLLTEERLLEGLDAGGAHVVCLDRDRESINRESEENLAVEVAAENTAYVIYTSGSTGQPKGVAVPHRGLLNLVKWHQHFYEVTAQDRATQLAGVAFDASVWELWPYLTTGASLYLPDEETRSTPARLQAWLTENAITISFLPTPLAESVLALAWPEQTTLRAMLTGGDKLHTFAPESARFKLVNNYGPTENTVVATAGEVSRRAATDRTPHIGRQIANVEVYLLDAEMQPVPTGVAGELYIGGDSLARGYLNRPALTAERFVPHPFSRQPGARLYRTGDLARYLADGQIDFQGRLDQQVKVRGFRIELGEIEAVLAAHKGVREAVVIARDTSGGKQLAAYVVAADTQALNVGELRNYLRAKLPEYMLPSSFAVLDALPLTPNGKVDRRALPEPERWTTERDAARLATATPTEEILAGLWCEVLGTGDVSVDDNFFETGGHSLLATQLMSRVRETFGVELPLRSLFEQPTVAGLAATVEREMKSSQGLQSLPMTPVPREGALPLSFAQHRFWFLDQLEPGSPLYNIPAAVRLTGDLNIDAMLRTLNEVVRRHEILRTNYAAVDGQPVQNIAPTRTLALPVIDLQEMPAAVREAETQLLVEAEARRPFNLATDSLLRVTLLRLAPDEHVALMTMHHIVSDGWSMGILIREIGTLYDAFSRGEESPLAELEIQYADYAVWQQNHLRGETLDAQIDYWRRQLAGVPMLELPTDHPRPPAQTFDGTTRTFVLPAATAEGIRALSRQSGTTVFMTLMAAFQVLLRRYTGQDDIVIGTGIANRNRFETEQLLGCFFNLLALRTDLSSNPTFRELLWRVRDVTLGAYAHQDIPFEKLLEVLQPERDARYSPLFQVALVLQNAPEQALELPGLMLSPLSSSNRVAKFDMNLVIEDSRAGLVGTWEYNTDLFDEATITRMIAHFETLLASIVANPDQEIEKIEMTTEEENRELAFAFDDDLSGY